MGRVAKAPVSWRYELIHLLGLGPWEREPAPAPLRQLVEGEGAPRPARALDLGCGSGQKSAYLAARGWRVTGVDAVERALRRARRRAASRGLAVEFVRGDVTSLDAAGVHGPFQLLLDCGCFHGLVGDERRAYARSVARVAAPGATLLMFAFGHWARLLTRPRGATRSDIEGHLGEAWELEWTAPDAAVLRRQPSSGAAWYRLRRRS